MSTPSVFCSDEDILSIEELDGQIRFSNEQVSFYLKKARELREKRNERTRSNRLMEHVLQYIFTLLAHDPTRHPEHWDSMRISCVCRRWREIAKNTKEVWSNIRITFPTSVKRIRQYLSLSKNAELSITLENGFGATSEQMGSLLYEFKSHRKRITKLILQDITQDFWNDKNCCARFEKLIGNKLQHLIVHLYQDQDRYDGFSYLDSTNNIHAYAKFSPKLLSGTSLTRIHLTGLSLESSFAAEDLPLLENVIELVFRRGKFYLPLLLNIFKKCPRLESLSVFQCNASYDEQLKDDISLPYLKNLYLQRMAIEAIFWLLRYLQLPDTSNWTIECNPNFNHVDTFQRANRQLLLNRFPSCESLDLGLFQDRLRINSTSSIETKDEAVPVTTSFLIRCKSYEDVDGAFNRILDYLPLSNWKTACKLHFEVDTFRGETITEHMWGDLLGHLDNLTFLGIRLHHQNRSKIGKDFLKALRRHVSPSTPEDRQIALCSSLKELSLRYDKCPSGFLLELEHTLDDRRHCNVPIQRLWLSHTNGFDKEAPCIADLLLFVDHLHWNAVEIDDSDYSSDSDDTESIISDQLNHEDRVVSDGSNAGEY